MIIRILTTGTNINVQPQIVRVVRVYNHRIPTGIEASVLTQAGSLIVSLAASTPAELQEPAAAGLVLTSNPDEPLKMEWAAAATGGGSIELTNKSGSNQVAGTVVILDRTNDSAFTTTTVLNDRRVIGVLEEDIDNNASGQVAVKGKIVTVKVQGNVDRGVWLIPSATAGRAAQYGIVRPSTGGIGVSLTSYSGGGAGTVLAVVDVDIYSAYLQVQILGTAVQGGVNGTTVSATFTQSSGSNRIGFAFIGRQSTQTLTAVTWGGVAMTLLATNGYGSQKLDCYYILESSLPANGSKTVSATTGTSGNMGITVFMVENGKQQAPSPYNNTANTYGTYLSAAVTTTVDKTLLLACAYNVGGGGTFTHDTGQTEIIDGTTGSFGTMGASYEEASTGSNTQGITCTVNNGMALIVAGVAPV